MSATAPFSPGSGWLPGAPLPGGRDREGRAAREARRQASRQHGSNVRLGLGPTLPQAWLEEEVEPAEIAARARGSGRIRVRRIAVLALVTALVPALAVPRLAEAIEVGLTTRPATDAIVRVLADDAGHRFDRGHVREVESGVDGTLWVAVGRRVLALGTPGAVEPQNRGWQSVPRRISARADGALWAVEDGGGVVKLTADGWTKTEPPLSVATVEQPLDGDALQLLRSAGDEHPPRVLAAVDGLDGQRWLLVDVSAHPDVRPAEHRMLRFDGSSWTVFGPNEGMPQDELGPWTVAAPQLPLALTVDQAGRAWFSLGRGGLWLADDGGIERMRFPGLGTGALDLASTPDGAIWIASSRGHLFRWNPEAQLAP